MEPITPKAPSEASVSAETEVGSSSAVQGPEKPLDGIDLCLIALRGQPGVAITDGRIIACADDAAVASAAELSSAALRHLNELVFNNVAHKLEAFHRGVVPLVTEAMVSHRHHSDVLVHGCVVLRTLTFKADTVKDAAAELGVVHAVVDALKHAGTLEDEAAGSRIAESALTALCSVCANHDANVASAKVKDAADAITTATARFAASPIVSQRAAFALALLTD